MASVKRARIAFASLAVLCLGAVAAPAANAYNPRSSTVTASPTPGR